MWLSFFLDRCPTTPAFQRPPRRLLQRCRRPLPAVASAAVPGAGRTDIESLDDGVGRWSARRSQASNKDAATRGTISRPVKVRAAPSQVSALDTGRAERISRGCGSTGIGAAFTCTNSPSMAGSTSDMIASSGHTYTHASHSWHLSSSTSARLPVSPSTSRIARVGHASTHAPHPVHRSSSM